MAIWCFIHALNTKLFFLYLTEERKKLKEKLQNYKERKKQIEEVSRKKSQG